LKNSKRIESAWGGASSGCRQGTPIFHTYSCFGRGLENTIGAYNYLDLVPKGRDEGDLPYGMNWLRLKDQYEIDNYVDPYLGKVK
jgi:predicted dithiol-disulfide oxidoreductase (DUF899 family)